MVAPGAYRSRERRGNRGISRGDALGLPTAEESRHFALRAAHACSQQLRVYSSSGCDRWQAWARAVKRPGAPQQPRHLAGRRPRPPNAKASRPFALRAAHACSQHLRVLLQQRLRQVAGMGVRRRPARRCDCHGRPPRRAPQLRSAAASRRSPRTAHELQPATAVPAAAAPAGWLWARRAPTLAAEGRLPCATARMAREVAPPARSWPTTTRAWARQHKTRRRPHTCIPYNACVVDPKVTILGTYLC